MNDQRPSDSMWSILAGMRFVLASCVVVTHTAIVATPSVLTRWIAETGYPAVFGFLMISGYSIGACITAREKGYFKRRVKRIYPAYLLALAFAWSLTLFGPLQLPHGQMLAAPDIRTIVGHVFMLQGISVPYLAMDGVVWTLSIEWWCYMLAIFLVRADARLIVAMIGASFASMMVYCLKTGSIGGSTLPFGFGLIMLPWAWLTGFVYFKKPSAVNFMLMLALPLIMFDAVIPQKFASVAIAGTAVGMLFAKTARIESRQAKKWLNFLGDASYPLYLLHQPLIFFVAAKTPLRNSYLFVAMALVVVVAGYWLTTRSMDIFSRRLKAQGAQPLSRSARNSIKITLGRKRSDYTRDLVIYEARDKGSGVTDVGQWAGVIATGGNFRDDVVPALREEHRHIGEHRLNTCVDAHARRLEAVDVRRLIASRCHVGCAHEHHRRVQRVPYERHRLTCRSG